MSDKNSPSSKTPQPNAGIPPQGSAGAEPGSEPQKSTENPPTEPVKKEKVMTESEVNALLNKVRSDEKGKLYPELESLRGQKTELETRLAELEESLSEAKVSLEELRGGKSTELQSLTKELELVRKQHAALTKEVKAVAKESEARVKASELKAYRVEQIQKAGIRFSDRVTGGTQEEINASIKSVKEDEIKVEKEIEEKAREKIQEEFSSQLPNPISPDGQQGRGPSPAATPANRLAMAKLKGPEYEKQRGHMLAEAMQKLGVGS